MWNLKRILLATIILPISLNACGLYTPEKNPFYPDTLVQNNLPSGGIAEDAVVRHIRCEIGKALRAAYENIKTPDLKTGQLVPLSWLKNWGTAVTLTLTVEDQSALAATASFINPVGAASSGQFRALGLGATGSANATRTETIQFTYLNSDLLSDYPKVPLSDFPSGNCQTTQNGVMVDGDLRILEFIYDKAYIAAQGNANEKNASWPLFNTLTDDVKFVASYGGGITPTIKLIRNTFNTTGTFINATRTNTDEVIVTLGPIGTRPSKDKAAALDQASKDQHNARNVGNAVTTGAGM